MITLQISKNKILTSVYTNNYSGENNFETLQVICEKFISGQDISKLETKIYFSFPNQTKDILLVDFEEVNGQLLALYKIEQKYTQFIGNIKVFAKFVGSDTIGNTNEVTFTIKESPNTDFEENLEDTTFSELNQYELKFTKIKTDIENLKELVWSTPQNFVPQIIDNYFFLYNFETNEYENSGVGVGGESAYQIAVDNGFIGDETAWLESLKGADYVLTNTDKSDIATLTKEQLKSEITIPTKTSELENDSSFVTSESVYSKANADAIFATKDEIPSPPDISGLATKDEVQGVSDDLNTLNGQVETNTTNIGLKADKTIILNSSETTVILTPMSETEYRYSNTLTSLTLTLPSEVADDYIIGIVFTSGETATAMIYPDTIKWIGDGVVDNVFVPVVSKTYNIILWFDGCSIYGVVKGGDVE